MALRYKTINMDCGYRLDLVINNQIILEIKAVDHLLPVHDAQLLTFMKLAHCRLGMLINFNEKLLKQGIRRFVL